MKKFLAILAIAGSLVACNDSSDSSTTTDTTNTIADTNTMVSPMDTTTGAMAPSADTTTKTTTEEHK